MKEILQRTAISFAISLCAGLLVNLIIDLAVNLNGETGFISMSPDFKVLFPTPVIAAYVNMILYGLIGAVFSGMTFIFDCRRIGLVIQWVIYFVVTSAVCISITVFLWQLHKYPQAIISTLLGYALTYVIIGIAQYRKLKSEIRDINEALDISKMEEV